MTRCANIPAPPSALTRFLHDDRGTQLVETAVMIGIVTAATVLTVSSIGQEVLGRYVTVEAALP